MEKTCKNFEKCPIYSGVLKDKTVTSSVFKIQYCDAGERGWNSCKRYQVKEKTGKCPADLLPNSEMNIEEIIASMA